MGVPHADGFEDRLLRWRDRLAVYLRILIPRQAAFEEVWPLAVARVRELAARVPENVSPAWFEDRFHQFVAEYRRTNPNLPFTDDLLRQLAAQSGPWLDQLDAWRHALQEVLNQLPPPEREQLRRRYELRLSPEQIASLEQRPVSQIRRDQVLLNATLVSATQADSPLGPPLPGGALDLGRMADQLLDDPPDPDGLMVLETLLLSDPAAQAHYVRHVALACLLDWRYRGGIELPRATHRLGLSFRERLVTWLFVICLLLAAVFAGYVLGSKLSLW